MSLFHRHRWAIHSVHFTPPPQSCQIDRITGTADQLHSFARRIHEGVTNVYLRCEGCGAVDSKEVYGKMEATPSTDDELTQLRKLAGLK